MWRKAMRLISFGLVLALVGSASAATFDWDGAPGALWNVPENWDPDGLPTADDTVQVYLADANCVIDDSVIAECSTVSVGSSSDGTCYLDMTGGTLNVAIADAAANGLQVGQNGTGTGVFIMSGGAVTMASRLEVGTNGTGTFIMRGGTMDIAGDKIEIGKNASGVGAIYVEGGAMTLTGPSADLEIASYGTGTFQMTGGLVTIEDLVKLSQGSSSSTTGVSHLNLYGGVLDANGLRNPAEGIYGSPRIDITEGTLLLRGDDRAIVNEYISRGWLVAYNGLGLVDVTADPNQTIVTGRQLPPELASNPTPADRMAVSKPVVLSWKPGIYAVSHDVYLGTDFNDVNDAGRTNPLNVLVSQGQDANSYAPSALTLGQTYYWRVDEVDDTNPDSPWKGVVFRFEVAPYVIVDDFESYNDIPENEPGSNLVYLTWTDGFEDPAANGGTIGYLSGNSLETTTVHGGLQSVPIGYNDKTAPSSEVSVNPAALSIGTDWSGDGLATLSLWFYGNANNSAEQVYIKLNGVKVAYNGPAADLQQPFWHEWQISLDSFGIDLSNVTDLTIGFDKGDAAAGGTGTVWFDDIRLTTEVLDTSVEQLARWSLNSTTTTSSSASDKVTAPAETVTSLYVIRDYSGIDGSQRVYASGSGLGYWPDETAENLERYAQFAVTPKTGVSLKVTSISLFVGNSGGSSDVKASIFYSTDGFVTSTPLDMAIALPSSALQQQTYAADIQVQNGKTFSLRVYPWLQGGRASGKYFNIKDVVISGSVSP